MEVKICAVIFHQYIILFGKIFKKIDIKIFKFYRFTQEDIYLNQLRVCANLAREKKQTRDRLMAQIDSQTLQKIVNSRTNGFVVRDQNIRSFAMDAYREIDDTSWKFKASNSWVYNFKKKHCIVSRKTTKIITRITAGQEARIQQKASDFVDHIKQLLPEYSPTHVLNADQIGFPLEMTGGRTLDFKGTRQITQFVQRKGATTHSCTVLPTITMDGELFPILFIQMKEKNGAFPQGWTCQYENVFAVAGIYNILLKNYYLYYRNFTYDDSRINDHVF